LAHTEKAQGIRPSNRFCHSSGWLNKCSELEPLFGYPWQLLTAVGWLGLWRHSHCNADCRDGLNGCLCRASALMSWSDRRNLSTKSHLSYLLSECCFFYVPVMPSNIGMLCHKDDLEKNKQKLTRSEWKEIKLHKKNN